MKREPENASTVHLTVDYKEMDLKPKDTMAALSEQFTDIRNTYGVGNIYVHLLKPGETDVTFSTATADVLYDKNGFAFCQTDGHVTDREGPAMCSLNVMTDLKDYVDKELGVIPDLGDALASLEQEQTSELGM